MILAFDADQDCSRVAEQAVQHGAHAVCRYLKNLAAHEVATLSGAGLKIVSIWETTARRALAGFAAGHSDGMRAREMAEALGQPHGSAVYATADFDVIVEQEQDVLDYFRGFRTGLAGAYRPGAYANGAVCARALSQLIADYTWLAGGMGMRGSRAFAASGQATIIQDVGDKQHLNVGIAIDSDVIEHDADFGGWMLDAAALRPLPAPVAPASTAEDDPSDNAADNLNADELARIVGDG